MDGNQNITPELPVPQAIIVEKEKSAGEYQATKAPEKQAVVGESLKSPPMALPTMTASDASQIAQPISTVALPITDPAAIAQQATADDADVIEKQWVERAKAIVAKTRNDPREQSREFSKFKAEYVQKRFNKQLKIVEDVN